MPWLYDMMCRDFKGPQESDNKIQQLKVKVIT